MPLQPFGQADPPYDSLRSFSNQALEARPGEEMSGGTGSEFNRIVIVDCLGNGDFMTLEGAMDAITDASSTNRYGVIMMPGVYTVVGSVALKDNVSIIAYVPGTVRIVDDGNGFTSYGLLDCAGAVSTGFTLRGLIIECGRSNKMTIALYLSGGGALNNVVIENCHIKYVATSGNTGMALDYGPVTSGRNYVRNCVIETTEAARPRSSFG